MPTHYDGDDEENLALDLFIKLVRAAASVERRTNGAPSRAGLTTTQFGALETLYHVGALRAGQLAEKHLKSPNNFTVVIANLERRGLIRREMSAQDRRVVLVDITDAGRALVEAVMPEYVRTIVDDFAVLTASEQRELAALLKRLGTGVAADEDATDGRAVISVR